MNSKADIIIDGSQGEGGGQVLRTAITLSMITGQSFEIKNIRGKRNKSGLLRQHLTAVNAAAAISQAKVEGAQLGSTHLHFSPKLLQAGEYEFAIGSAGSCMLVLQTVLPALWFANGPSTITVSGGTHNKAAPPAHFLIHSWWPLMMKMGVQQVLELEKYGFYPAGGGRIRVEVTPCKKLIPINLLERGQHYSTEAEAIESCLPNGVAYREILEIQRHIPDVKGKQTELSQNLGPGNVVMINTHFENINLFFTSFGEKKISAERVAKKAVSMAQTYLSSSAIADEYLADQLLLPMALAGSGGFTAESISLHFTTNIEVIQKFLPIQVKVTQQDQQYLVEVTS